MRILKQFLIKVNRKTGGALGLFVNDFFFFINYCKYTANRLLHHPSSNVIVLNEVQLNTLNDIKKNGFAIIPKKYLQQVDELLDDFNKNLEAHNVSPILDDNHFFEYGIRKHLNATATTTNLITEYREKTNNIQIKDPEIHCKTVQNISKSEFIVGIASKYLGVIPISGPHNFRISFANALQENDTQIYHQDKNAFKVLKFFIYLNDVDINGGPFEYVRNSNFFLPAKLRRFHRISEKTVNEVFPGNALPITANKGDLIIADTTGIHRGLKPKSKDRIMLTLTFRSN